MNTYYHNLSLIGVEKLPCITGCCWVLFFLDGTWLVVTEEP